MKKMEYAEIIDLLNNTTDQPSKIRRKKKVELNDDLRESYKVNSQIKLKTKMLKSSLCDYSDS